MGRELQGDQKTGSIVSNNPHTPMAHSEVPLAGQGHTGTLGIQHRTGTQMSERTCSRTARPPCWEVPLLVFGGLGQLF